MECIISLPVWIILLAITKYVASVSGVIGHKSVARYYN
jgi:hypothetical protein